MCVYVYRERGVFCREIKWGCEREGEIGMEHVICEEGKDSRPIYYFSRTRIQKIGGYVALSLNKCRELYVYRQWYLLKKKRR